MVNFHLYLATTENPAAPSLDGPDIIILSSLQLSVIVFIIFTGIELSGPDASLQDF